MDKQGVVWEINDQVSVKMCLVTEAGLSFITVYWLMYLPCHKSITIDCVQCMHRLLDDTLTEFDRANRKALVTSTDNRKYVIPRPRILNSSECDELRTLWCAYWPVKCTNQHQQRETGSITQSGNIIDTLLGVLSQLFWMSHLRGWGREGNVLLWPTVAIVIYSQGWQINLLAGRLYIRYLFMAAVYMVARLGLYIVVGRLGTNKHTFHHSVLRCNAREHPACIAVLRHGHVTSTHTVCIEHYSSCTWLKTRFVTSFANRWRHLSTFGCKVLSGVPADSLARWRFTHAPWRTKTKVCVQRWGVLFFVSGDQSFNRFSTEQRRRIEDSWVIYRLLLAAATWWRS